MWELYSSFGYDGSKIEVVDQKTIAYTCGNGIKFLDLTSNKETNYLWSRNSKAISAFAFSKKRSVIALSEKGIKSEISLYQWPSLKYIRSLRDGTELEYNDLAFSRDGSFLASLGSFPDNSMIIWDWDRGIRLAESSTGANPCEFVSFNPRNKYELCTSGKGQILFWKMEKEHIGQGLTSIEGKVTSDASMNADIFCHCWGLKNEVYCGTTEGEIIRFDPATGEGDPISEVVGTDPINCIVVSKHHFIAGSEDGVLRFYSHLTQECSIQYPANNSNNNNYEENPPRNSVLRLALNSDYSGVIVGSGDGQIYSVNIDKYSSPTETDETLKKASITTRVIMDGHAGPIVGLDQLANQKVLVSCGKDCTLRLWDYSTNTLLHKVVTQSKFTCLSCSPKEPLVAVGSELGVLQVFNVTANGQAISSIFRERLTTTPILEVKFDKIGRNIALTMGDNSLFFLKVTDKGVVMPLGSMKVGTRNALITSIHWVLSDKKESMLYVTFDQGDLYLLKAPTQQTKQENWEFPRDGFIENVWRLDYTAFALCDSALDPSKVFVITQDKKVKAYQLTDENQIELKDEVLPILTPTKEFRVFDKQGTSIVSNLDGSLVAAGASDGSFSLFNLQSEANFEAASFRLHDSTAGGLFRICISHDSKNLFTAGLDGFIYAFTTQRNTVPDKPFTIQKSTILPDVETEDELIYPEKLKALEAQARNIVNEAEKDKLRAKIADLRLRLKNLMEQNQMAPELEQLARHEFIVDVELKKHLEAQGEERIKKLNEEIKYLNLGRELLAERIKKECWDTVEEHLTIMTSFESNLEVPNYIIRKTNPQEQKLLQKIKFLRRVEELDLRHRKKQSITYGLTGGVKPTAEEEEDMLMQDDAAKTDEQKQAETTDVIVIDPHAVLPTDDELLYSPFDLYTRQRKVTQIHLLLDQIQAKKLEFNKLFHGALDKKRGIIDKIDDKNKRIEEIMQELGMNEEIFRPRLSDSEIPEKLLKVEDSEVKIEKYISPEEQRKREEARLAEEEKLRREKGNDSGERALQMMMNGTLERRDDNNDAEKIERPDCLDKPKEELTEDDKKLIAAYEAKLKKRKEEEEKKRKQLEAELNNIKQDIKDMCRAFETELQDMFNKKLECDQVIFENELRVIKLAQSILQQEKTEAQEENLQNEIEVLKRQSSESASVFQEYNAKYEQMKEKLNQVLQEDRQLGKALAQRFPEVDAEMDEQLKKLLKKRPKAKPVPSTEEAQRIAEDNPDPFADVELTEEIANNPLPDVIDPYRDMPDGCPPNLWEKLLEIRAAKMKTEQEIKRLNALTADMSKRLSKLTADDEQLRNQMLQKIGAVNKFHDSRIKESYNLDLLFRFKQGQIEVEQEAVVTDYSRAILVNKSVILELNDAIVASGNEKVKILKEIKDTRKENHRVEWLIEKLDFDAQEVQAKTKRLQLLRVTKAMQALIKGGGEGQQEAERIKLQKKHEHVKTNFDQRVAEKKKVISRLKKLYAEKEKENAELQEQVKALRSVVAQREHIHGLQSLGKDRERNLEKMKDLRVEKRLAELVQKQQEEVDFLRAEVARLRERTFPSFAIVEKRRLGNPDQKNFK